MNAEEICAAAAAGRMTEQEAIAELRKLGFAEEDARELVFIAQGGNDVVGNE